MKPAGSRSKKGSSVGRIEKDAKGQFVGTQHGAKNSGVSSAKPRVITGTEDATFDSDPAGRRSAARKSPDRDGG